MFTRFARWLIAVGLGLSLTACSGTTEKSATEHNSADVEFLTVMIQHHAQAMAMVNLTNERSLDPEVATLAEEIRMNHSAEIEEMVDHLDEWSEPIPETVNDHANAGHGEKDASEAMAGLDHADLPGMLTAEQFAELEGANDAEFQGTFLKLMIEHHEGAVEIAETEQSDGQFKPVVAIADGIVKQQRGEIDTMRGLQ